MERKFSLAGLMRVRELQEEQAAADLALANSRKLRAEQDRIEKQRVLAEQEFPKVAPALVMAHTHEAVQNAATWHAVVAARASVAAMLRDSNQVLRAAEADADQATQEWHAAKTRAAMIEKLKQRHDRETQAEELRNEQLVLDEAALRRTMEVTS